MVMVCVLYDDGCVVSVYVGVSSVACWSLCVDRCMVIVEC